MMEKLVCLAAIVTVTSAATGPFSYMNQAAWADSNPACGAGKRQSPIRIISTSAREGDNLMDLVLVGWNDVRKGRFSNTGTSAKFTPNDGESVASTTNHQGDYELKQFHMHWGAVNSVGSEHVVDGMQASAEIHFVHRKTDGPDTAGNAYAVVGVVAVADENAEISDLWSVLNATAVEGYGDEINASVRFSDILPSDLSYYYYEGSLTTPGCNEVVQWFLLKEFITVPEAYLQQLRKVEHDAEGNLLTFNYRNTQDLNGRTVSLHTDSDSSGEAVRPLLSLTVLSLLFFMLTCRI